MSALGYKQTFAPQKVMSALPPKADICGAQSMSAKCQKRTSLIQSPRQQRQSAPAGTVRPSAFAVLKVDARFQISLVRGLHGEVGGFVAAQDMP